MTKTLTTTRPSTNGLQIEHHEIPASKDHTTRTVIICCLITAIVAMIGAVALSSTVFAHTGPTGARGVAGQVGPTGIRGVHGRRGQTGKQGKQGVNGQAGANGADGENGAPGATGAPGTDNTFNAGTDGQGYAFGTAADGSPCSDNPDTTGEFCPF
jgi:hypothetical protein